MLEENSSAEGMRVVNTTDDRCTYINILLDLNG